jgi:hypothetical protein
MVGETNGGREFGQESAADVTGANSTGFQLDPQLDPPRD